MTIDDRAPVYQDGDLWVYRASALGLCLRALTAARQGCPPCPPGAKQAADLQAGIDYETVAYYKLRKAGYEISREQEEIDLPAGPGRVLRMHIDGVADRITPDGLECTVLEIKSLAPSTFKAWQRGRFQSFPSWGYQMGAAMIATGREGLMCVADRSTGIWGIHGCAMPPILMGEMCDRIADVERLAAVGTLPPCPATFPCPYFYLHDHNISGEGPVLSPEATPEHIRVVLREARQNASGAILERVEERLREVGEL